MPKLVEKYVEIDSSLCRIKKSTTDFIYNFDNNYENIIEIELLSCCFRDSIFNITNTNNTIKIHEEDTITHDVNTFTFSLTPGYYTIYGDYGLKTVIENELNKNTQGYVYTLDFNNSTGRITISTDKDNYKFEMQDVENNMYSYLGYDFTQINLLASSNTANNIFSLRLIDRVYVTLKNTQIANTLINGGEKCILGSIDLEACEQNGKIYYEPNHKMRVIYSSGVDINTLVIKLEDNNGNVIDLNNQGVYITIKMTIKT